MKSLRHCERLLIRIKRDLLTRFVNKVRWRSSVPLTSLERRQRRRHGVPTAPKKLAFTAAGTPATVELSVRRHIGRFTKNIARTWVVIEHAILTNLNLEILCFQKNSVIEAPPAPTQQVNKQTNTDIPLVIQGSNMMNRQLVLRSTQQVQQVKCGLFKLAQSYFINSVFSQLIPSQLPPPVPVQQHYILPACVTTSSPSSMMTQPIIIGTNYQHKNHAIRAIYSDHAVREAPTNLVLKKIHLNDNPNAISKEPLADSMLIRVNNQAPASSSTMIPE